MQHAHFYLIGRRLSQTIPIILFATFVVFALLNLVPEDPALILAGEFATAERVAEIRHLYGFDQPLYVQYGHWLYKTMQGDLGLSLLSSEKVATLIEQRLPHTLFLAAYSMVIALLVGIPLGVLAAVHQGSKLDAFVTSIASLGVAVPSFWLAIILVVFFALDLGWFPVTGASYVWEDPGTAFHKATLPAVALALSSIAELARQVRSALLEVLESQFVRTLWAKGLGPRPILWKHCLRNICVTLLTLLGLLVNRKFSGSVVIEAVFAIPGVGSLAAESAVNHDFPVVQGVMLVMVVTILLINLIVDLLSMMLDPRVAEN